VDDPVDNEILYYFLGVHADALVAILPPGLAARPD